MKYHFTEPTHCCNVATGGYSLPFVEIIADAGHMCCRGQLAVLAVWPGGRIAMVSFRRNEHA
jgi:hypothetical protein